MSKQKKQTSTSGRHKTILRGKLDISKSGMGYVIVEGRDRDVLVKPGDFGRAFNGDTVRVEIPSHLPNGKRAEGQIIDVVERKQTLFMGSLQTINNTSFFIPGGDKPIPDFFIPQERLNGAVNGDRVQAKLVSWGKGERKPEGEIVMVIKAENEADLAMKEILLEAGFPLQFEFPVLKETAKLSGKITREELSKRKDFRDILTFTIDPVDAKDFDDAISIRNLDNGYYEVGVHIADVSHFVTPGSELDKEAYKRATSVYLPDRVNPMLPEKISNELCSLRPNEEKYCFSAVFQITNRAEIKHTWIGRSVILSDHRFTYEDVQTIIEKGTGKFDRPILLLDNLAKQFRAMRFESGAINFSSQEVRFTLDEKGNPTGIVIKESKDANKLVEEFMLLANKAVAEFVSKVKINKIPIPFPYRIHDKPDEEKLKVFAAFAKKFGYDFDISNEDEVSASFNKLLSDVEGKPEQHVFEQLGIRTMSKASYSSENKIHYGLGFQHYCHFTSPIRRYPDVMVHRILQQVLSKSLLPDKQMDEKCLHCSEQEKAAMEAERAGNKYKQVQYMKNFLGEEFEGIISGVASFGFWVETVAHKCEGFVSMTDISDYDEFIHDDQNYMLRGVKTGQKFRMGDKVLVKVVAANLTKRQLDYQWVPQNKPQPDRVPVKPTKKKIPKK
ncbi:MAG: ribonuclease R [Bacteroidetes bacterium]|nr:ribonuclease R [Bacteroidota bacterium]